MPSDGPPPVAPQSQDIRDQLMRSLEMGASFHVDPAIRRTCLQTLAALATAWCLEDGSEVIRSML